ncbi:MAG TPA: type IV pilus modification protein PilV [Denitromonas sp.]|uniref:type IV pilus modification protein PilV n=1 Tax=Denitromonas sp. TaxID=2734609 RepID=UPI002BD52932|nr:type IV pilus modification protein PilV [Denitromonas sp.]
MTYQARITQRGFSLIEALIAMVVLSIGLLGLAGLQVSSLKFNQTAQLRSKAVTLAYDMQERVRASFTEFSGQKAFATAQLNDWQADVAAQLPAGQGVICWTASPATPGNCVVNWSAVTPFSVISVNWSEANDAGLSAARQAQTIQIVSRE